MWRDPGRLESGALGARRRQLIGAGVFATSGHALADLGSSARVLWVRAVAGGIAVCGAIAFAALIFSAYVLRGTPRPAPAKPRSLGVYAYMRNPGAPPVPAAPAHGDNGRARRRIAAPFDTPTRLE